MNKLPVQLFLSIPLTRPLYKRDALNACCFPVGDHLDLAFGKKWISDNILQQIKNSNVELENRTAVLIFCEERESIIGDAIYRFHPIRRATIKKVVAGGDSVTFQTELGDFFSAIADVDAIHKQLIDESELHPNHARLPNNDPHPKAKFVRLGKDNLAIGKLPEAWNELVRRFASLRGISDSLFFVATDRWLKEYPKFAIKSHWSRSHDRREAHVKRGSEIDIVIYGVPGEKYEFNAPLVIVSEAIARVSGPYIRQYGDGYLFQYFLQLKAGWDKDHTMMNVSSAISKGATGLGDKITFRSPEVAIHLKVNPRWWALFFVVLFIGGGNLLTSLDKDSIDGFLPAVTRVEKTNMENRDKQYLRIAKLLGTAFLSFGVYLGFRKLPGPGSD